MLFTICSPIYNLLWYNKGQETVLYCFRSIPPPLSLFLLFSFARRPVACDFFCSDFHFLHWNFHKEFLAFMGKIRDFLFLIVFYVEKYFFLFLNRWKICGKCGNTKSFAKVLRNVKNRLFQLERGGFFLIN